jgi:hypothetical protein
VIPTWDTRYEMPLLRVLVAEGMTPDEVHEYIPTHTPCAIELKARRMGLSWRRPGSRRGLVIGQPRNVSMKVAAPHLHALILAGKVRPQAVAARIALSARTDAELCPKCCMRPIAPVERSRPANTKGVCIVCHVRHLVEVQQEELAVLEARKELLVVWQRKSRLKRELDCE